VQDCEHRKLAILHKTVAYCVLEISAVDPTYTYISHVVFKSISPSEGVEVHILAVELLIGVIEPFAMLDITQGMEEIQKPGLVALDCRFVA
jgi:hypothetical protein